MLGTGAEFNRSATRPQRYDGISSRTTILPSHQSDVFKSRQGMNLAAVGPELRHMCMPARALCTCHLLFSIFSCKDQLQSESLIDDVRQLEAYIVIIHVLYFDLDGSFQAQLKSLAGLQKPPPVIAFRSDQSPP
jgi:hypothetical protein